MDTLLNELSTDPSERDSSNQITNRDLTEFEPESNDRSSSSRVML